MHFGITRSATLCSDSGEGPAQVNEMPISKIGADHEVAGHLTLDPNDRLLRGSTTGELTG